MLLSQLVWKPWACFSAIKIQSLPDNSNLWFDLFLSLSISFFFSLLELLPYLTPNLKVSSCVSFGSVSTSAFSVICSWSPSRSQMCYLFLLKHLGHDTILLLQRSKPTWNPRAASSQAASPWQATEAFQRSVRRGQREGSEGDGNPGAARAHTLLCVAVRGS